MIEELTREKIDKLLEMWRGTVSTAAQSSVYRVPRQLNEIDVLLNWINELVRKVNELNARLNFVAPTFSIGEQE